MRLRFPVAVWQHKKTFKWYAFPLGAREMGDLGIFPQVNVGSWQPICTMPDGTPVSDVTPGEGHLVECKLDDVVVVTAEWALED